MPNGKRNLAGIRKSLKAIKPGLEGDYHVKELGVFGSYVRGEQRRGSDLDVLVEFSRPIGLIRFMQLENYLSKRLGVKVDLVMKGGLKPRIGWRIMDEVLMI